MSDTNKLKMGDTRFTINILKFGQSRPYADTVGRYRVTLEWIPYDTRIEPAWTPYDIGEEMVRQWVKGIYGWSMDGTVPGYAPKNMDEAFSSTLTKFQRIDKGIWEWEVTDRFTD